MLEFKTPIWLDDIICVTNRTIEQHEDGLREVLSKLQDAGNRVSRLQKKELFKRELVWLVYHVNQHGVIPVRDKTEAITKLQALKNAK